MLAEVPVVAPAGQVFRYWGGGYQVLGAVVEAVCGKSWHDVSGRRRGRAARRHAPWGPLGAAARASRASGSGAGEGWQDGGGAAARLRGRVAAAPTLYR